MRTTIDAGGRIVIPKAVRDGLRLIPGQTVEVLERDGHIEISPAPTPMKLETRDGVAVALPEDQLPPLTDEVVRSTLEQIRR